VYFMIYLGKGKENTFIVMGVGMKENLRMIYCNKKLGILYS
jgi:hypothetical protein